jgi:predicted nucleotidyltransferase
MEPLPTWLTENERAALGAFVAALSERYSNDILSVRLFGSKARGDFQADSDLDILVLATHDDWRFRQAISFLAADLSLDYDLVLAPKVVSRARWEFLHREGFAIAHNVQKEGVLLAGTAA